ncbi:MAG: DUF1657 domain-containing protein [Bacillota bacterium]
MTIGTKMHQTLASLEGAAANLQTFALDTQDQAAKQMFIVLNKQVEDVCQVLKSRVNYIEQLEPQYRMMQPQQLQQQYFRMQPSPQQQYFQTQPQQQFFPMQPQQQQFPRIW